MGELVTWGVKMSEELKERIGGLLKESGLQGKEFVEHLAALYENSNVKNNQPLLTQDMEEIEVIARRLLSIFTNIGERVTTTLQNREGQYQAKLNQQQEIINMLHGKVKEQEQEINELKGSNENLKHMAAEAYKDKANSKNDYTSKVNQLTDLLDSNKALIEEYRSKNDTLTGLLDEYKEYKEKVNGLTTEMQGEKEGHRATKESLSLIQNKAEHLEQHVKELKEKHKEDILSLRDKLSIECEKESLKKDREYQNMIQCIREEYNTKVKSLLDEIENVRGAETDKGSKKK